jgi:6-phosphogluconolactonase (cycloisomerase 2 family)
MFTRHSSAVNENTIGALQSFTVDRSTGILSLVETISSGGNGPAYAGALTTGQVAIMNYGDGTGRIIPTTNGGLNFDASAGNITFPIPTGGEGVSHPHMALQYGNEVLVPDLVCFFLFWFRFLRKIC